MMRLRSKLLPCLILSCSVLNPYAFGQQSPISACGIPVVVTRFDPASRNVELVKNLSSTDFTAEVGTVPAVVASATIDGGPKRVAIILDASSSIPADEWKLEAKMAAQLVRHARSKDEFYILLVGTDNAAVVPLSSHQAEQKLKEVSSTRPAITVTGERVYDALSMAANRLSPPEFGDASVLFGHAEDEGSKANPDQVMALILKNRLRFYGISFFNPLIAKLPPGFNLNDRLPANLGPPKLARMATMTGYNFHFFSVHDLNLPGQLPLFEGFLSDIYAGIAKPYKLTLPVSGLSGQNKLTIGVTKLKERNIRDRDVHFPHAIFPCPLRPPATN